MRLSSLSCTILNPPRELWISCKISLMAKSLRRTGRMPSKNEDWFWQMYSLSALRHWSRIKQTFVHCPASIPFVKPNLQGLSGLCDYLQSVGTNSGAKMDQAFLLNWYGMAAVQKEGSLSGAPILNQKVFRLEPECSDGCSEAGL